MTLYEMHTQAGMPPASSDLWRPPAIGMPGGHGNAFAARTGPWEVPT